uniref:Putative Mitogen-activated protein kinase kinase kinase 13 n=1 Tax=Davidia involucrata TaxID=16924 RepID=A0A5B7BTZ5_DAVIN
MEKVNRGSNWVRGSCIGRGSFGTVSLAVSKSDGNVFAAKSVDRSSCLNSRLECLENEIRILRSLSSPYVVEYLGDDVTWDSPTTSYRNLHMEYLPGGTVADLAKQAGADVAEQILRSYTWCIVSALSYVHSKGIVHCDVKGKNVLVGPTPGTAKLADFGSATEFPAVMSPRGSPLWMAPEVIRREHQGPESDVWSLGCTVIELVTGKPAWEDRGADTLCRIGYSDELPEFPTQSSELCRDFLDKCLRRERNERWSCDQLLQHPFISSSSPPNMITYSSPRCVLDWFNSEFCVDEDDEEIESSLNFELQANSAKERISKLAANTGAIWESDGWVVVRNSISERRREVSDACFCGNDGEGTISEYADLIRTEEELEGTSLEYLNSVGEFEGTNLEYYDSGGNCLEWRECSRGWGGLDSVEAGSSCRYGSQERDWAVDKGTKGFTAGVILLLLFLFLFYFTSFICNSNILLYKQFTFCLRFQKKKKKKKKG